MSAGAITSTVGVAEVLAARRRSRRAAALRSARRHPLGVFGGVLVLLFVLIGTLSPLLTPYDATRSVDIPLLRPSNQHWLGTDSIGQDVFSRVLRGSQI